MNMPTPLRSGPARPVMGLLVLGVLLAHLGFLFQIAEPLQVNLSSPLTEAPVQLRLITVPSRPAPPPAQVAPQKRAREASVSDLWVASASRPEPVEALLITERAAEPASSPQVDASDAMVTQPSSSDTAGQPVESLDQQDKTVIAEVQSAEALPAVEQPAVEQPAGAVQAEAPQAQPANGWPAIPLGALPSSRLIRYQLTGMDKGLTYHASGELRWQHNDHDYEVTLSVRAFLVGSRHWRSKGRIDVTGLAPLRFSDSWRNERAAHFDRERQRVVFSSRSQTVPLEPGAQDQVSLYLQLAAAVAGAPERFMPGTRLQVQTATVRDAISWLLTLEGSESLQLQDELHQTLKWVCQPRSQYDARVEFWVTPAQAWMPVRIRITQVSGSYIDLIWRGTEPLPDLPPVPDSTSANTPS